MRSFGEAVLCVLALLTCVLVVTCTAKHSMAFAEKQCIGGFVWDNEKGYTGETCQLGFKG
jgi:hypothetical protein